MYESFDAQGYTSVRGEKCAETVRATMRHESSALKTIRSREIRCAGAANAPTCAHLRRTAAGKRTQPVSGERPIARNPPPRWQTLPGHGQSAAPSPDDPSARQSKGNCRDRNKAPLVWRARAKETLRLHSGYHRDHAGLEDRCNNVNNQPARRRLDWRRKRVRDRRSDRPRATCTTAA
jgi:hypothetical protein